MKFQPNEQGILQIGIGESDGQRIVIAVGELDTSHLAIHKLNVRPGGRIHFAKAEVALGEGAMIKIDFVEVYFRKGAV